MVPLKLIFPLQRVIFPQSRQSEKYRIVTHNFTNDDLTNGKTLVIELNYQSHTQTFREREKRRGGNKVDNGRTR